MDKEATDIWVFGRPRPDLTTEEKATEIERRGGIGAIPCADPAALEAHRRKRTAELLFGGLIEKAKAAAEKEAVMSRRPMETVTCDACGGEFTGDPAGIEGWTVLWMQPAMGHVTGDQKDLCADCTKRVLDVLGSASDATGGDLDEDAVPLDSLDRLIIQGLSQLGTATRKGLCRLTAATPHAVEASVSRLTDAGRITSKPRGRYLMYSLA